VAAVWAVHPGNPWFRKGCAITTFSKTLTFVGRPVVPGEAGQLSRLRREFGLDDETLEDLRHELIVKRLAVDEGGQGLANCRHGPLRDRERPACSSRIGRRARLPCRRFCPPRPRSLRTRRPSAAS